MHARAEWVRRFLVLAARASCALAYGDLPADAATPGTCASVSHGSTCSITCGNGKTTNPVLCVDGTLVPPPACGTCDVTDVPKYAQEFVSGCLSGTNPRCSAACCRGTAVEGLCNATTSTWVTAPSCSVSDSTRHDRAARMAPHGVTFRME